MQDINPQLVQQDIGHRFLAAMEGAMCTAVEAYVTLLEKECLKELPHEGDDDVSGVTSAKKKGGLEEHRPPVCITQSLCVKVRVLCKFDGRRWLFADDSELWCRPCKISGCRSFFRSGLPFPEPFSSSESSTALRWCPPRY